MGIGRHQYVIRGCVTPNMLEFISVIQASKQKKSPCPFQPRCVASGKITSCALTVQYVGISYGNFAICRTLDLNIYKAHKYHTSI